MTVRSTREERDEIVFTNREHVEQCRIAGCGHPPIYKIGRRTIQGWCNACRQVARREHDE